MAKRFHVSGYLAGARRLVQIECDTGSAFLPYDKFGIANRNLAHDLTVAGLPVFERGDLDNIIAQVAALQHFEVGRVADHVGWNDRLYAQHDGTVTGSDGPQVQILFAPQAARIAPRGTLAEWQARVAAPLAEQPIPAFALMAMFLPPLLRFMPAVSNPTFEFVGSGDIGKSTMLKVATSAVGPFSYGRTLRDLQRAQAQVQEDICDHPLVLDDIVPCLLTATKAQKAALFGVVAHDLARSPGGHVTLLSGRQPLRVECGVPSAQDDIITLMLATGEMRHGVFASVPEGYASPAAIAEGLVAAAAAQHGTAYPSFVGKLVDALTEDAGKVRRKLDQYQARFLRWAGIQGDDGTIHRVARGFAAVFAAGALALRYKVLPAGFPNQAAALAAWNLYLQSEKSRVPFAERLEELAGSGKLVTVTKDVDAAAQACAVSAALGTITLKANTRIVRIAPDKIEAAFPDWHQIKHTEEVRAVLKMDGKNLTVWGKLAPGEERVRLYQFALPLTQQPSLFEAADNAPADKEPEDYILIV